MKSFSTFFMKTAAIVVGLLCANAAAQATVFKPGEQVTEFVVDEDNGIITAPLLSTNEAIDNWAYGSYADGNVIAYTDQRGWRAVFEIDAPAAGKYGVEVKLRTTTTNWMVAFTASSGLSVAERASIEMAPEWAAMVRPTQQSTVKKETVVIQEAQGEPEDEGYIPAITEERTSFDGGDWETVYVPVSLQAGHNYVTFWLCRTYQGIDALKGPDGTANVFAVNAIKVMPQNSGDVAAVLQKATLKLWEQRMYPTMVTEAGKNLPADYQTLLSAYATSTDYSALSTASVLGGIEAVEAREFDLRHGQGVILNSDSVAFALPYYHDLRGGSISENERGEYSDAPMVFEYTNGKTLVYKFTTTVSGDYYPIIYAGTQLSTNFHMTILASDSTTVVMNEWKFSPNTGAWQVYQMFSQPAVTTFQAEAGQTYYLTLYFENYVNVRGLYLRQVVQNAKTYAELEELKAKAEDYYAMYQKGTDGYYQLGGDDTKVNALEEAIATASDLDEESSVAEITAAYYALQDAMDKIDAAEKINVIPTTEYNPFNLVSGTFSSWRIESGGNIGYGYANGYARYTVYNKTDQKYDINVTFSNGASDESIMSAYVDVAIDDENMVRVATVDQIMVGTGGWSNQEVNTIAGLAIPEGKVIITLFGTQAASNGYVGNIYGVSVDPVAGTEGEGKKALDEAVTAYYELYSAENLQKLIDEARAAIAGYPYPEYDQTQVEKLNIRIEEAEVAMNDEISARAKAYKNLQAAIEALKKSTRINWLTIPTSEENPFDLSAGVFDKWKIEGAGNIGYGYQGGSALYYVNVTAADTYTMTLEVSNQNEGGQLRITATNDDGTVEYSNTVVDVISKGSWNDHSDITTTMTLPAGRGKILLYGETAGGGFVGNIYSIKVEAGGETGIRMVNDDTECEGIYTLQGMRVQKARKGLYIINGKKVVMK